MSDIQPEMLPAASGSGDARQSRPGGLIHLAAISHPQAAGKTFKVLQALRAIAALLVVFSHDNTAFFGTSRYWPDLPFGNLPEFGHAGVEFFFVLSGFIIYAAHRRDLDQPAKVRPFVWKRFRRVYPLYWLVLLLVLPLYLLVPAFSAGSHRQATVIFDNILLVHVFGSEPGGEILTVAWTLFHEVVFYAVFALAIFNRRVGAIAFCAWGVASCVTLVDPALVPQGLVFWFSPLHLLFGMGMAVAWQIGRGRIVAPWTLAALGTALFFCTGADEALWGKHLPHDVASVCYGLGSTLVVAGGLELERTGRLRVARAFVFLGDASYSIYLVHFLAMSVFAKVAVVIMAHVTVPHALVYFALAIGSTAVGALFHVIVEVPLLAFLGRIKPAPRIIEQAPV